MEFVKRDVDEVAELVRVDVREPGGGAGLVDPAGDGVPVGGLAVLSRQQQRAGRIDVTGAVVVDEGDQLGVQAQVPVLAELADRDVQPRSGAMWTTASARSEVYSLTRSPVRSSISTVTRTSSRLSAWAARRSLAALASSRPLGRGWSPRGRSPGNIGTPAGLRPSPIRRGG